MEIFGVPVYLNFLSVVCFVPSILCILGAISISLIEEKSQNSWAFFLTCIGGATFQFGYALTASVDSPLGAYHRWLTVFSVFFMLVFLTRFYFTYGTTTHPEYARWVFVIEFCLLPILFLFFAFRSVNGTRVFRLTGQFWDFELPAESIVIACAILFFSILSLLGCMAKYRALKDRRLAFTFLILVLAGHVYMIPNSILNFMWRRGVLSAEAFLWATSIGLAIGFFIIFVIFLSHTIERSTLIGNLLAITLVAILVLIPFLAYPLIEDRKASFREIWAAKLQAGEIEDKNVVFVASEAETLRVAPPAPLHNVERGAKTDMSEKDQSRFLPLAVSSRGGTGVRRVYYRDSEQYYRKAIAAIPSDGVILRADAKGGVYTFPVLLKTSAAITRNTGNARDWRGPGMTSGVTRNTGNSEENKGHKGVTENAPNIAAAPAKQIHIIGIELGELRKYIHPTAAKLALAQFVVILVIVSLFPLFFRGILLNPMRRLLDGVIAISRGRYGHRIENQRSDELGVISRHFDKMAVTIEAATTRLEETVARRTAQLTEEKKKSDTLLLNILPGRIADELKEKGHTQPVRIDAATVLFTDFVGFTKIAENLTPEDVVAELDKCFSYFDQVTEKYGLEKLKTIGDSFMCAGGVPEANRTHAIDACLAALEIQAFMNQMKEIKHQQGFPYWELRLGINSGPLVAGVVGHKKFAYDVWGDSVNTASRMESSGLAGEINISRSTYDLVQKWFVCEHRGQVSAKNKGEIDMYLLKCIRPEYSADSNGRVPNENMKKDYVSVRRGAGRSTII